jgi:hypothetical protein
VQQVCVSVCRCASSVRCPTTERFQADNAIGVESDGGPPLVVLDREGELLSVDHSVRSNQIPANKKME